MILELNSIVNSFLELNSIFLFFLLTHLEKKSIIIVKGGDNMNTKKNISSNLKRLMIDNNINNSEMAKILGVSESTVGKWLLEKSVPRMGVIEQLSSYFGVNKSDILEEYNLSTKIESNFNQYKCFPVSVSAGALEQIDGIIEFDWITLSDELLGKYAGRKSIILLKVNGESMNKIIPDGSYIVVDTTKTSVTDLCDKDIVVFTNNGEGYSVKRYVNDTANQRFIFKPESDDDTFTPIIVNYEDSTDLKVVGKVVKYIVNLD